MHVAFYVFISMLDSLFGALSAVFGNYTKEKNYIIIFKSAEISSKPSIAMTNNMLKSIVDANKYWIMSGLV